MLRSVVHAGRQIVRQNAAPQVNRRCFGASSNSKALMHPDYSPKTFRRASKTEPNMEYVECPSLLYMMAMVGIPTFVITRVMLKFV